MRLRATYPIGGALRLALILVINVGQLAPARAADSGQALLEQAKEQFSNGQLPTARATLKRARHATADPALLAQVELHLALIALSSGRPQAARAALRRALGHRHDLQADPARFRPDLLQLLEQERAKLRGRLSVESRPSGRSVWVDGKLVGRAPCTVSLPPGRHVVHLRGPGGAPMARREVSIVPHKTLQVALAVATAASSTQPVASTPPPGPTPRPTRRRRLWTWVTVGAAAATGAAALGLGLWARAKERDACDLLADPPGSCADRRELVPEASRQQYEELYQGARDRALAANILWGVAGGLAVTSAVLFFLEPGWGSHERRAVHEHPRVGLTAGGITLDIPF